MNPIKIAFFTNNPTTTALSYLRVIGPASYSDMKILMGSEYKDNLINCINQADLVIIQREFPADLQLYRHVYDLSRKLNKPIVYDFDDYLFGLPENHPDRKSFFYTKDLMPMFMAALEADYITVSNDYLKQKLSDLNRNIFVLPNLLDEEFWPLTPPSNKDRDEPLVIGYMGGDSHLPDLEYITPTLLDIKTEFSDEIRFHFYGLRPPDSLLSFSDTIWTPIKTYDYKEFAGDFQKMDVDLFIAPLIDNEFNRCKSPIKFFEYSSLGVPGIYSNVYPYREIIKDGETGLLASSHEEWGQKFRLLLHDSVKRYQLAENAQKSIINKYLMSQNSDLWLNTYQKIINQGITTGIPDKISPNFVKDILEQIQEYQTDIQGKLIQKTEILEKEKSKRIFLESRLDVLQEQNKSLEQEVLFYALSNSWQITRPLRKIKRFLQGKI